VDDGDRVLEQAPVLGTNSYLDYGSSHVFSCPAQKKFHPLCMRGIACPPARSSLRRSSCVAPCPSVVALPPSLCSLPRSPSLLLSPTFYFVRLSFSSLASANKLRRVSLQSTIGLVLQKLQFQSLAILSLKTLYLHWSKSLLSRIDRKSERIIFVHRKRKRHSLYIYYGLHLAKAKDQTLCLH